MVTLEIGKDDEVLVPDLTFISRPAWCGFMRGNTYFVDADRKT
jgi:dTDP-4-amino-4,6-dideoxygalactose transaminase